MTCKNSMGYIKSLATTTGLKANKSFACEHVRISSRQCVMSANAMSAGTCVTASGTASSGCSNGTFSRACNTAPCQPTAWLVGPWGACSKTCADSHGPGTQTRTVGCYQYSAGNTTSLVISDSSSIEISISYIVAHCNFHDCIQLQLLTVVRQACKQAEPLKLYVLRPTCVL